MISILRKVACVFVEGVLCALCVFDLNFKVKGSFYLHNSHLSSCLSCLLCFWLFYIFFHIAFYEICANKYIDEKKCLKPFDTT